jgi:hypothetical protein
MSAPFRPHPIGDFSQLSPSLIRVNLFQKAGTSSSCFWVFKTPALAGVFLCKEVNDKRVHQVLEIKSFEIRSWKKLDSSLGAQTA